MANELALACRFREEHAHSDNNCMCTCLPPIGKTQCKLFLFIHNEITSFIEPSGTSTLLFHLSPLFPMSVKVPSMAFFTKRLLFVKVAQTR